MKKLICAGLLLLLTPLAQAAVTDKDLVDDAKTPDNVLTQGMGYDLKRYSPLNKINRETVKRLVPVWSYSMNDDRGQESQPLVVDGVMYVTDHKSTVAINATTGRQVWKHTIQYPPETPRIVCCGILNRGAAVYGDKLYRTTLDASVIALDLKTGAEVWRANAIDWKRGYSMTMPPLIANGVVVTGVSGAEFGIRGFLDGWDPETGRQVWRTYTVPGPGEKGNETWIEDQWAYGGGSTWLIGSYDPQLDLMYWGVGNPSSWNVLRRKGDNLYTCSVIAMRPKTGEIVWHYQFSPNDPYDYDGNNEMVLADLNVDGKPRKVLMHADRNGYFYVIDRTNGQLLRANPFVKKITWADGIDMKTGRPIDSAATKKMRTTGEAVELWPHLLGGKNWMPMSYNPGTGLVYANTLNFGFNYKPVDQSYEQGVFWAGVDLAQKPVPPDGPLGFFKAIDPLTGKSRWEVPLDMPNWAGTLTTAGGLVFTGNLYGEFLAYDASTGKKLWSFQTGSGVIGQPVTWTMNGKQYISVLSGTGGAYVIFSGDPRLASVPKGGSVWTFALK
jgi:alcohol dehydrogenase (cytochrome c)